MSHKHLLFCSEAREKVLRGASAIADAVRVTLGPKSKCVLIEKKWGKPLVCNDGVTIAKEFVLKDQEENLATAERAAKVIQGKLDRLDEAFLFERSIDIDTYDRHAEKLRQELTLLRIDRHSSELDELDVEGILAFAERILPRAADLWVQASLEQRQRFQQLFFPEGIAFDGNGFVGTAVTAPAFNYLRPIETGNEGLVDLTGIEPVTS